MKVSEPAPSTPPPSDAPASERSIEPAPSVPSAPSMTVDLTGIKPRSRGSDAPPPSSYPVGAPRSVPPPAVEPNPTRASPRVIAGGAALAIVCVSVLVVLLSKPSCLFTDPARPVSGVFKSKHLGLMMSFPDGWKHAEGLDTTAAAQSGFEKKNAVFFRGTSATDFVTRLEIMDFTSDASGKDQPVSDEAARIVGGNEALENAVRRSCEPLVRGASRGTRCTSFVQPQGDPFEYATLEEYFPLGSAVVFARGSVKVGAERPPTDDAARRTAEESPSVAASTKELEALIATVDTIR